MVCLFFSGLFVAEAIAKYTKDDFAAAILCSVACVMWFSVGNRFFDVFWYGDK